MQIEYKITFGSRSVTLAENIQPDPRDQAQEEAPSSQVRPQIRSADTAVQKEKQLAVHRPATGLGGSDADKIDPGGGALGRQTLIISCPIVITYLSPRDDGHRD